MLQKMKKIKIVTILLIVLTVFIIPTTYLVYNKYKIDKTYENNTKIMDTISRVLDINTLKYNYSNIITVKKDKSIKDIKIPFTEKSFIIKYNGVINAGISIEDVSIVENNLDKIYIKIKDCKILEHYIDSEDLYVYDIKTSIFNKLEIQEILDDLNKHKKQYEEKIIEEGFLNEARESTKIAIESILKNIGYEEVIIEFI